MFLLIRSIMALEYDLTIKCPNSKVTVIGNNPTRREFILGFEDGSVQTFDHDTGDPIDWSRDDRCFFLFLFCFVGEMVAHCYKHRGWVTALCSLPEARAFFSSGNDSTIVTYNGKTDSLFYLDRSHWIRLSSNRHCDG